MQVFACRDETQAVMWLLRGNRERNTPGILPMREPLHNLSLTWRGWNAGIYAMNLWDTRHGRSLGCLPTVVKSDGLFKAVVPVMKQDIAIAVRRTT